MKGAPPKKKDAKNNPFEIRRNSTYGCARREREIFQSDS